MEKFIVRYKLKPGRVEENEKLIEKVYEQLQQQTPEGLSYATFKLEDGLTFIHIAISNAGQKSPLSALPAFKTFQSDIVARCEELPVVSKATEIGSFGFGFIESSTK